METALSVYALGVILGMVPAMVALAEIITFGGVMAAVVFWPITLPIWLLLNLWRLAKRIEL
jgi:hypothetical protein